MFKVLEREPDYTVMLAPTKSSAKKLSSIFINERKQFSARPQEDGKFIFTVVEENAPSKWEYS